MSADAIASVAAVKEKWRGECRPARLRHHLPNQGGLKNPAAVFTAPDCADAFLARLTEEQRRGLERVAADGMTLIKKLPLQQIDGMLINAFGPGPAIVLFFAEIEDVNSLYDETY